MMKPLDSITIAEVLYRMLGGDCIPCGETNADKVCADRQKIYENLLDALIEDLFETSLGTTSSEWSRQDAGNKAESYLYELWVDIGERLNLIEYDYDKENSTEKIVLTARGEKWHE